MTCRSGSLVITALSVTSGYETGLVCKSLVPRLPAASLGLQQPTRLAALDLSRMGISAIYVSKYLQYDGEVCATSPAKYAARVANTRDCEYSTSPWSSCTLGRVLPHQGIRYVPTLPPLRHQRGKKKKNRSQAL